MTTRKPTKRTALSALLFSMILIGCGGGDPKSMLASAKDYMAKNDNKAAVIQLKNALQVNPDLAEARFLLGKSLLESGNPTSAEVELRKAADLKYPADQVAPLLARSLLMLGQTKKITEDLAKVELTAPESKAALQTTVGQAYLAMGKVDGALTSFNAALTSVPGYAPAIIGQARIKAGNRDLTGAMAMLDASLEKQPKLYEAWQLKGDILTVQGDTKGSVEAYQKVLELMPDYLPAHAALVSRLMNEGKLDAAGKQLETMKKIASAHPQTAYLQSQLAYRQKNFKAAQEAIRQHLKTVPDSVSGLQLAGAIEYELKSYSTAETYLLKILNKTPELGLARRILVASYLRSGQQDKALAIIQPVIDKMDKDSNMLALAGEVFMQNGDADKASEFFARASALDPEDTGKRTSVALSHLAKGETDIAYKELEKIASVDTGIKADLALIASQLKERQFDHALKSIAALEKKQPENPLTDNLRGTVYLGKGDATTARKSFEHALVKNPAYVASAVNLANLDLAQKKPEDAKKRFESVLSHDPKNLQALLSLAELKAKTGGKPEEVADLINKAVTANPNEVGPRLALTRLYLGTKDYKKAVSTAQDALAVMPDRQEILDVAGQAQQLAGDLNQALATYGKLSTLTPNSVFPYLRMAEIQLALKNKESAMQSLHKALSVKADSIEAQRGILMLDLAAGRTVEALASARQIQKQHPKEAAGYILEGDVHALKQSWKEAVAAYRNGTKKTGAVELVIKLHAALTAGGSVGEAEKFADSWLKDHPKDLRFRLYLAESANAKKDYATASKHYAALLEVQPNNPAMLNNLAWTLSQQNAPKAIEYAEKAYKIAPEQPAIIDTFGMLLVQKGDMVRGLELLQKASGLAPQNALIRFNLAKALVKAGKKSEAKKELDELAKLGEKFPAQPEVSKLLQNL